MCLKTYAKIVDLKTMDDLKHDVVVTPLLLKKKNLPFFDTMTHLLVHLVEELKICVVVHTL
jgi:hypothetical protein